MSDATARLSSALADRYRIERELGTGGMATVYLAEDLKHNRKVAIKVLKPELGDTLGPERFIREIQTTAALHHPHILPLYDSGAADGLLFYVMPLVEGESLRDRLTRDVQLPVEDALAIVREAADALSYAHARGVVHRDIKPENILLENGHAVVADFGIARAVSAAGTDRITQTGMAVGTPLYMSPEQATGTTDVDGRADQYALACVLYELLAGQPPFTGPTPMAIMARHSIDPVPSVRTVRGTIPEHVEAAMSRALAKVPADRFPTVRQFAEAVSSPEHAAVPTVAAAAPRRRRKSLVVSALVVAVTAAAIFFGRGIDFGSVFQKAEEQAIAVLDFDAFGLDSLEYLATAVPEFLSLALTGDEGGAVAVDRGTVLGAWREMAGAARDPGQRRVDLAARVGATHVVTGQVIRQRHDSVLVTATMYRGREEVTQARAVGPAADGTKLAERIGVQLLAASADEFGHLPGLMSSSTDAVQHWLAGRRAYRNGNYRDAMGEYQLALERDSTFALAGWGLMLSDSWYSGDTRDPDYVRGRAVAWRNRGRLPRPDSVLLAAESYRNGYPERVGEQRTYRMYLRAVQDYPNRWEHWFRYGDYLWHEGGAIVDDALFKAAQAFERAIALDSTAGAELYAHLMEYAAMTGDLDLYDRLATRHTDGGSSWLAAIARNDRATLDSVRTVMEADCGLSQERLQFIVGAGIGRAEWDWMADVVQRCARHGNEDATFTEALYLLDRGRPGAARAPFEQWLTGRFDMYWMPAAVFWGADTARAAVAAARWEELVRDAADTDRTAVIARCMLGIWKIDRGTVAEAVPLIASLRETARHDERMGVTNLATTCATVLDAWGRFTRGEGFASADLAAADSIYLNDGLNPHRGIPLALVLARLHAHLGETETALRILKRKRHYSDGEVLYLSTVRLAQARLAAELGRRGEAIAAYRHYLMLMDNPEPAFADQVAKARTELAGLEQS